MINSVVVELRPRLQSCNVFILTEPAASAVPVKLTVGRSFISLDSGSNYQLIPFKGPTLIPNSISSFQVEGSNICLRLQTQPKTLTGSFGTEVIPLEPSSANLKVNFVPDVETNQPLCIVCKCCGHILSKGRVKFKRVLPLPSSEWEDSELFCHQHEKANNGLMIEGLCETDCLYGHYFVQISSFHLVCFDEHSKVMHCSRCLSWLGTNSGSSTKLWNCTTKFFSYPPESNNTTLMDFINLVKQICSESLSNNCKIVLSCNVSDNSTHHLLLCVMEKHLEVLIGVQNVTGIEFSSKQVLKVLFLYHTENTDILLSWLRDPRTQNVYVAKQMLLEGLHHLKKLSSLIPCMFQVSNSMYVSYICDSLCT